MYKPIALAAALLALAGAAQAEDWTGAPVAEGTQRLNSSDQQVPKTMATNQEYVGTLCQNLDPNLPCASGVNYANAQIPITAFARSTSVDALRQDVGALNAALSQMGVDDSRRIFRAVALASALDFQSPAPGSSNRLGGGCRPPIRPPDRGWRSPRRPGGCWSPEPGTGSPGPRPGRPHGRCGGCCRRP